MKLVLHMTVLAFAFLCVGVKAGIEPYTERPRIDFDVVYKALAPHGTWKADGKHKWVFVPKVATGWRPYQNGRWAYSDGGWLWLGRDPWSWATDHYGFWVYEHKTWKWIPQGEWHPAMVVWQENGDMLLWRPVYLNKFGEVLNDLDELREPDSWNGVSRKDLFADLNGSKLLPTDKVAGLLVEAEPCVHVFTSYRQIERPGPDPEALWKQTGQQGWVFNIMTLPSLGSSPPAKAPAKNIYLYRPVFAQDDEGILRRIQANVDPDSVRRDLRSLFTGNEEVPAPARSPLDSSPEDPASAVPDTKHVPPRTSGTIN